ncbi:MAG: tRNA-(ms[2]io[6]A)-hydroxylase [Luminiphilus sp.]|jgi:tRNA-(ms[2]io[6]A)-hydroxylase
MTDTPLKHASPPGWVRAVMDDFDHFLLDHAAAEKKASGMALSMVSHYPDRTRLVAAMTDLAVEEMVHFREVVKLVQSRGLVLGADEKDPYVNAIRALIRQGSDVYLLDRLLTAGVIEARGAERFGLVAEALPEGDLKNFYRSITRSECRHFELFLDLAREYFPADIIESRWQALLETEGQIIRDLPLRAALH